MSGEARGVVTTALVVDDRNERPMTGVEVFNNTDLAIAPWRDTGWEWVIGTLVPQTDCPHCGQGRAALVFEVESWCSEGRIREMAAARLRGFGSSSRAVTS